MLRMVVKVFSPFLIPQISDSDCADDNNFSLFSLVLFLKSFMSTGDDSSTHLVMSSH